MAVHLLFLLEEALVPAGRGKGDGLPVDGPPYAPKAPSWRLGKLPAVVAELYCLLEKERESLGTLVSLKLGDRV